MKKTKHDHKEIFIYGDEDNHEKIVVLSGGSSKGHATGFTAGLARELAGRGHLVLAYDYDFLGKGNLPEGSLEPEADELGSVLEYAKARFRGGIILMGKSLGGVLSLFFQAKYKDERVDKVCILGLPLVLGYPVRLGLLKEKDPVLPDYYKEYEGMLRGFATDVTVVQGEADDLYDRGAAEKLFKDIKYIKNADHSFYDSRDNRYLCRECADACAL